MPPQSYRPSVHDESKLTLSLLMLRPHSVNTCTRPTIDGGHCCSQNQRSWSKLQEKGIELSPDVCYATVVVENNSIHDGHYFIHTQESLADVVHLTCDCVSRSFLRAPSRVFAVDTMYSDIAVSVAPLSTEIFHTFPFACRDGAQTLRSYRF